MRRSRLEKKRVEKLNTIYLPVLVIDLLRKKSLETNISMREIFISAVSKAYNKDNFEKYEKYTDGDKKLFTFYSEPFLFESNNKEYLESNIKYKFKFYAVKIISYLEV